MGDVPISLDDLEKLAKGKESQASKKKGSTKRKSRGTPPAAEDTDGSTTVAVTIPKNLIYKVIHYYTRTGDTFSAVRREARSDASLYNSNVRFVVHGHDYETPCDPGFSCSVIVGERDAPLSGDVSS